jgi:membrane protease subunit (stomatin/prohibitin family)
MDSAKPEKAGDLPRADVLKNEYCNDCGALVTVEDEGSSNFYCDCGNEWTEGEQDDDDEE